jgi:hypothetical protein
MHVDHFDRACNLRSRAIEGIQQELEGLAVRNLDVPIEAATVPAPAELDHLKHVTSSQIERALRSRLTTRWASVMEHRVAL